MVDVYVPEHDSVVRLGSKPSSHIDSRGLQIRLDAAQAGDVIELITGEYQGPFLVDKPLTIRGRGRLTPLWTHTSPVLLVICDGVVLDNVLIETTVSETIPPIFSLHTSSPELRGILPPTLRSQVMSQHQVIDLGVLIADKRATLTFEFDTSKHFNSIHFVGQDQPALIKISKSMRRNRHGLRRFQFSFDAPNEEGLLLEQVHFSDNEHHTPAETYLLKAKVQKLGTNALKTALSVKQGNQECSVYFERMLELGQSQLAVLSEGRNSQISDFRYGVIIPAYDDEQTLERALWIPSPHDGHVSLNNEPLHGWTRRPIKPNDVIKAAGLDISVRGVKPNAGRLQFNTFGVDFGKLQGKTDHTVSVTLTNRGGGLLSKKKWIGTAHSLVDWLLIPEQDIEISTGKSHTLNMTLHPNALQLKNGNYSELSAIAICCTQSEKEIYFLDAHLQVDLPQYAMQVHPYPLIFKGVIGEPLFANELSGKKLTFNLENIGRKALTYKIIPQVPWLNVSVVDGHLTVGESILVECMLTGEANLLTHGTMQEVNALQCVCVESGHEISVGVIIEDIRPPRLPEFDVQMITPRKLHINLDSTQSIEAQFTVTNIGALTGEFSVSANSRSFPPNALIFSQTKDQVAPGDMSTIILTIDQTAISALHPSRVDISVEFVGGEIGNPQPIMHQTIILDVVDEYPIMSLTSQRAEFTSFIEGHHEAEQLRLIVENTGLASFEGEILSSQAWLSVVNGSRLNIAPNQQVFCNIALTSAVNRLPPGHHYADLTLERYAPAAPLREKVSIRIFIIIMSASAIIYVMRRFLWFGSIEHDTDTKALKDTIILFNMGYTAWRGEIVSHAKWVQPEFKELVIPPLSQLRIPVSLAKDNFPIRDGMLADDNAIVIHDRDNRQHLPQISARVFLVAPHAKPFLDTSTINFDTIIKGYSINQSSIVRIINEGAIPWGLADIKVPEWLTYRVTDEVVRENSEISLTIMPNPSYQFEVGEYSDTIEFHGSDGQTLNLSVSLKVDEIRIEVTPTKLYVRRQLLGEVYPVFIRHRPDILTVRNDSVIPITFIIHKTDEHSTKRRNVIKLRLGVHYVSEWLKSNDSQENLSEYEIPPGEEIQLRIMIKANHTLTGIELPSISVTLPNEQVKQIAIEERTF